MQKTGNAGGRPRGLAAYIREQTDDGREMVDFMVKVMRGGPVPRIVKPAALSADGQPVPEVTVLVTPDTDQRMEAITWLADRAFGKPTQKLEGEVRAPSAILHRTPPYDPLARVSAAERVLEMPTERALPVASCPPGKGRGSR